MIIKKSYILVLIMMSIIILPGCSKGKDNYDKGIKAFEQEDYETAANEFAEAVSLNSNRGDYFVAYGDSLLMLERYEESINIYNQVIREPNNKIVRENNKESYYGKGIAYYNLDEYDKAIEQFDLALDVEESAGLDLNILLYKADTELMAKKYKEGVDSLTRAIAIESNDPSIYYKRALAYKELDKYDEAEEDLDIIISLKPDNYDFYFSKYLLLDEQNKTSEADKVLDEITSIKIDDETDRYNNAKANYYLGKYDAAREGFNKSIESGILEANFYLARIMESNVDYQEATQYYEKFLSTFVGKEDKDSKLGIDDYYLAMAYNQSGYSYLELESYDKALDNINKGLELKVEPLQQALLRNKIVVYESLSNFEEAYEVLEEYVSLYPEDEEAIRELEFVKTRLPEASKSIAGAEES